ncbi:MAG: sigma factor, partial [Prevotella sp.]
MSDSEERILSERIKKGDEKALDELTKANLKFVVSIANKFKNKGVDIEDLISEGNLALIRAAKNFDAERGVRFVS